MNGMRFFLASTSRPLRDLARNMPLPPAAAISGTMIHRPGMTMSDFSWATAACEPNSSVRMVDRKKVAMHSGARRPAMR